MKTRVLLFLLAVSVNAEPAISQQRSVPNPPQQTGPKNKSTTNLEAKGPSKSDHDDANKSADIEAFIIYAQSLPAEFSADLIIQLAESGQIKDLKRRQDLLVDAFYTAAKAKQPLKRAALPGSIVDSRSGYRANAFRLGLDALSLQSRAIKALLPLNKQKARQLFEEIKLKLDPLNCEDTLAYNVDAFFDTTLVLVQTAFPSEEIRRGEHIYFIENHFSRITSANEIRPAIRVLVSLKATNLELARLGHAFSTALTKVRGDRRSFAAPWNSTMSSIDELVSKFHQRGLSCDEIIESYRTYLINQLSGDGCAERDAEKLVNASLVTHFNEKLRLLAYKNISAISDDEIRPGRPGGSGRDEEYWTSAKSKRVLAAMRKLRFKANGDELKTPEKRFADWESQLSQLIRELASWSPTDEKSEEDYFHQKSVIYSALIDSLPAENQYDALRDEALRDFTNLVSTSELQKQQPAEWFLHAKILIDRAKTAKSSERDKLLTFIYNSHSTVLRLYAQKDQL